MTSGGGSAGAEPADPPRDARLRPGPRRTTDDFAVLYRWRITPGREEQFQEGWRRVTLGIVERCGSFGSRLHRADDGTWVAYARWPSAAARDACSDGPPVDPEGSRLMREASEYVYDDVVLTVVDDLLREPPRS